MSDGTDSLARRHPFRLPKLFVLLGVLTNLSARVAGEVGAISGATVFQGIEGALSEGVFYWTTLFCLLPFLLAGSLLAYFCGVQGSRVWVRWPMTVLIMTTLILFSMLHCEQWLVALEDQAGTGQPVALAPFLMFPFWATSALTVVGVAGMLVQTVASSVGAKKN